MSLKNLWNEKADLKDRNYDYLNDWLPIFNFI
jgi:hypothetical protein